MFDIVYCIDENFNYQCGVSIESINSNLETDVTFHIIHKKKETFLKIKRRLEIENKINIKVYQFEDNNKLEGAYLDSKNTQLTDATYYRFFISNYIPKNIEFLIYLDADVFAINSLDEKFLSTLNKIKKSKKTLGALDVNNYDKNLNKEKYFNVGVMFINYKKWRKIFTEDLQLDFKEKNLYSDQDILNKLFNNDFFNIDPKLNVHLNIGSETFKKWDKHIKSSFLIHYVGRDKPWNIGGVFKAESKLFIDMIDKNNFYFSEFTTSQFLKSLIFQIKNILKNGNLIQLIKIFFILRKKKK